MPEGRRHVTRRICLLLGVLTLGVVVLRAAPAVPVLGALTNAEAPTRDGRTDDVIVEALHAPEAVLATARNDRGENRSVELSWAVAVAVLAVAFTLAAWCRRRTRLDGRTTRPRSARVPRAPPSPVAASAF